MCCPDMGVICMAVRGPAGKSVKHGHTPSAEWTEVANVPYQGPSPDLPKLSGRKKWSELVAQWWEQVRVMPHCVNWGAGDWQFGLETALMKDAFWKEYSEGEMKSTMATEIRRREAMMGTTVEARRQLRIRYVTAVDGDQPGELEPPVQVTELEGESSSAVATVTPLHERRARLTRAAAS